MHCLRLWLPLLLLPLPSTSPFFLYLFLLAYALQTRPCAYCSAVVLASLLSLCAIYSPSFDHGHGNGKGNGNTSTSSLSAPPLPTPNLNLTTSPAPPPLSSFISALPICSPSSAPASYLRRGPTGCWMDLGGRWTSVGDAKRHGTGGWLSTIDRANLTVLSRQRKEPLASASATSRAEQRSSTSWSFGTPLIMRLALDLVERMPESVLIGDAKLGLQWDVVLGWEAR